MEGRKIKSRKRYLWAFLIGTTIFILIFVISYSMSFAELRSVSGMQNSLAYNIFQDKLNYTFFNNSICSNASYSQLSSDLATQGSIINDLEQKLGKNNPSVLNEKKFYTLVELEHFEFVQDQNKECNSTTNTILFFYSNSNNDIKKSENLGNILTVLSERNSNLMVYSFDINLDSPLITLLKNKYNVTEPFTLIVNGNTTLYDPQNIDEIEKYLVLK